jgi:hypothetical protein
MAQETIESEIVSGTTIWVSHKRRRNDLTSVLSLNGEGYNLISQRLGYVRKPYPAKKIFYSCTLSAV